MTLRIVSRRPRAAAAVGALALACALPLSAQGGKQDLREKLSDLELVGAWIYDDIDAGFAQARQTGKPALVVFR